MKSPTGLSAAAEVQGHDAPPAPVRAVLPQPPLPTLSPRPTCPHKAPYALLTPPLLPPPPPPHAHAHTQPDAVSCLVVGTESGRLLILNTAGTAIAKNIWIGVTPSMLAVQVGVGMGWQVVQRYILTQYCRGTLLCDAPAARGSVRPCACAQACHPSLAALRVVQSCMCVCVCVCAWHTHTRRRPALPTHPTARASWTWGIGSRWRGETASSTTCATGK